ncbi:hypothetical protein C7E19_23075 [Stenotrophomonas maltophilia]|nr:hypothetical protein C7E19_23075 [Stenotrophomonas maltophilia]
MPTMPALIRIPSVLLLSLACSQALAAVPAKAPVRAAATEELALEPVMAGEFALQAKKLLDMLEDLDDVQDVYSNAELGADAYA